MNSWKIWMSCLFWTRKVTFVPNIISPFATNLKSFAKRIKKQLYEPEEDGINQNIVKIVGVVERFALILSPVKIISYWQYENSKKISKVNDKKKRLGIGGKNLWRK